MSTDDPSESAAREGGRGKPCSKMQKTGEIPQSTGHEKCSIEHDSDPEEGRETAQRDDDADTGVDDDGEDDGDKDDDGEDEEDEDAEDEEPALKYERIGGALTDLLKKDSASALAISNKLLVNCPSWSPTLSSSLMLHFRILGAGNPCWHRSHSGSYWPTKKVLQATSSVRERR